MEGIDRFYLTNHSINDCKYFRSSNLDLFKSKIIKTISCKIKKLCMQSVFACKSSEGLGLLNTKNGKNNFENLEQLKIHFINVCKKFYFKLPNLKILEIDRILLNSERFVIDCPSIFALKTTNANLNDFDFQDPKTITHLHLYAPAVSNELSKFANLEYVTYYFDHSEGRFLDYSLLKCLKELSFISGNEDNLRYLLKQKKLKNSKYKIYQKGFSVETEQDLDNYVNDADCCDTEIDTKLICLYYDKTKTCMNYCRNIDYTLLTSILEEIPENFFKKFNHILKLSVSPTENGINKDKFIDFISNLKDLRILDLYESFDQHFYNNLHNHCPYLNRLDVKENENIDLDFLLHLKNLKMFSINQHVPLDKIRIIFDSLNEFCNFKSILCGKSINICQGAYDYRSYGLYISYRPVDLRQIDGTFVNLESFIRFFKTISDYKGKKSSNKTLIMK